MFTHRVSEYFGDIIEVEHKNKDATKFNATHYGEDPWSKHPPLFANREEKLKVFQTGCSAKRSVDKPPYTESSKFGRFFVITKFKAVTTPTSIDKPEKRRGA